MQPNFRNNFSHFITFKVCFQTQSQTLIRFIQFGSLITFSKTELQKFVELFQI